MSKNKTIKSNHQPDLEAAIMDKVMSNQIVMRPKWYFIVGSIFSFIGLVSLSVSSIFFTNIMIFSLRRHGPMSQWRLEALLESLPFWVPIIAVVGIIGGIWCLKRYDFSYQKNFAWIIAGFVIAIVMSAWVVDHLGLNEIMSKRGQMRRFYQQTQTQELFFPPGRGGRYFK